MYMPFSLTMMLGFYVTLLLLIVPSFGQTEPPANPGFCSGPRTPGELRLNLWAGQSSGYDRFTRPGVANATEISVPPPDVARVQLHVLSLAEINQKRNEFQLNVWFRRRWNDFRFQYLSADEGGCFAGRQGFPESILDEIWAPDLFVENQIRLNSKVAGSVWIQPNGDVIHVSQLLITLACNMDFEFFPHDTQHCGFKVGTFLEDAQEVVLDFWEGMEPITLASKEAANAADIPHGGTNEWEIIGAKAVTAEGELHGALQSESTVEVVLELERKSDYYSDFVILPAVMFVIIGWATFFLSRTVAPARVTMSIVGFLANTNFLAAQLGQLPRLGNDVWLLRFLTTSMFFSFYSVMEYILCNWMLRIEARIEGGRKRAQEIMQQRHKRKSMVVAMGHHEESAPGNDPPGIPVRKLQRQELMEQIEEEEEPANTVTREDFKATGFIYRMDIWLLNRNGEMYFKGQHVDVFSRYAYPLAYGIACCILWYA